MDIEFLNSFALILKNFVGDNQPLIYIALFITIFCEIGLVITPFLPGDSLVFAIGSLCAVNSLNLTLSFFLIFTACILGELSNYLIGAFFRKSSDRPSKIPFIKQEQLDKTSNFYSKYGGAAIFFARFMPVVRTLSPFMAGMSKMNIKKFMYYNLLGGFLWTGLYLFAGFFFSNIPFVERNFSLIITGMALVSFIPSAISILKNLGKLNTNITYGNTVFLITLLFSVLGFGIIAYLVLNNYTATFDSYVYSVISKYISPHRTEFFAAVSDIGGIAGYIIICLIILIIPKFRTKFGIPLSFCVLIAAVISSIIKPIFARPRPLGIALIPIDNFSFPSSHSASSFAFYFLAVLLVFFYKSDLFIRILTVIISTSMIFLIGYSRIYLGVHYTSDVLAGYLLGLSVAITVFLFFKKAYKNFITSK